MKFVLSVGYHSPLLKTRNDVLTAAGYEVLSATSVEAAMSTIAGRTIDVLVLGHLVPQNDRTQLARAVRSGQPRAKVIMLYSGSISGGELADALISVGDPLRIVETIESFAESDGRVSCA